MKRSKPFHQTSTPISELCVSSSPPCFKRLSAIQPIGKKKITKRNTKSKRLKTSDEKWSSSVDTVDLDASRIEHGTSASHCILPTEVFHETSEKISAGFDESVTKRCKRSSNTLKFYSQSFHQGYSEHKRSFSSEKKVYFKFFDFQKERLKNYAKSGKYIRRLKSCIKSNSDTDEHTTAGKISASEELYVEKNKLQEISKCVLSLNQKDENIKKHSNYSKCKVQKKALNTKKRTTNTKLKKNNENVIKTKCFNRESLLKERSFGIDINNVWDTNEVIQNPVDAINESQVKKTRQNKTKNSNLPKDKNKICDRYLQQKKANENRKVEKSFSTKCNAESTNVFKSGGEVKSKYKNIDFITEFNDGVEWHIKNELKNKSQTRKIIQHGYNLSNSVKKKHFGTLNTSFEDSDDTYKNLVADIALLNSQNENPEASHNALISTKNIELDVLSLNTGKPSLHNKRRNKNYSKNNPRASHADALLSTESLELDVLTSNTGTTILHNNRSNPNAKTSIAKNAVEQTGNKGHIVNPSNIKKQSQQKSKGRKSKGISGLKNNLREDTLSYPPTSTPFDSPEVQTRRMPSMLRNLSPVTEEQTRGNRHFLDDIEPTLIFANKTYGKDRRSNNTFSKSDKLWMSMKTSSSETRSMYTTNFSYALDSKTKSVSETAKSGSEATLFESPSKDISIDPSSKEEIEKPMKKFPKKRHAIKTVNIRMKSKDSSKDSHACSKKSNEDQLSEHFKEISNWSFCIEPSNK